MLLCLRAWLRSGIIKLDEGLLRQTMVAAGIDDDGGNEVMISNIDSPIYLDDDSSNDN
jgi:hypothetical protein